jgi:cyclophilin family peptidyl-prolyl cis-trans isomerase
MSSRKHVTGTKAKTAKQALNASFTQFAAIAVVILLLAAVAWIAITPRPAASPIQPETASQPPSIQQYSSAPEMTIDPAKRYIATFTLTKGGQFVIELYPAKAPITVNSFVFLARAGFYNGTTFHRVLEGFMAQGGDPTGTGMGGPGYKFVNEDSDLTFDKAGVLAMANAGRDTNGSQFFITFGPQEMLNGNYTIFGQVIEGLDVVMGITLRDPQQSPDYPGDSIESITIAEE